MAAHGQAGAPARRFRLRSQTHRGRLSVQRPVCVVTVGLAFQTEMSSPGSVPTTAHDPGPKASHHHGADQALARSLTLCGRFIQAPQNPRRTPAADPRFPCAALGLGRRDPSRAGTPAGRVTEAWVGLTPKPPRCDPRQHPPRPPPWPVLRASPASAGWALTQRHTGPGGKLKAPPP